MAARSDPLQTSVSILREISTMMIVTDDITSIADLMLDLAIKYTRSEKGSLMLTNDRGELYIFVARGIDVKLIRDYKIKIGEGIAGTVASNRSPIIVKDINTDPRFRGKTRDRYKTTSFISCPILSKSKLLGVLNINDKKDGTSFTQEELFLVETIANQAAVALENSFLVNQLEKKAAQLEEINKNLISADVMKTEFFMRISHELRTPLNSIKGSVYHLQQLERATKSPRLEFYGIIAEETNKLINLVEDFLSFIRRESEELTVKKSVIDLSELFKEISDSKLLKTALTKRTVRYTADIPKGLSNIVGDRIKIFQLFINLIEGLAAHAVPGDNIAVTVTEEGKSLSVALTMPRHSRSIQPADLFSSKILFDPNHTEESLKLYLARRVAEIHRWVLRAAGAGDKIIVSLEIPGYTEQKVEAATNNSLEIFIDLIAELLDLNRCSIMLSDQLTGELAIRCARGLDKDIIQRTRIRMGDKIAGWVAMEGKPLFIENIEDDVRFARPSIPQYSTKSLLSLPLKVQNRVVGVINLNNKKNAEPFTQCDFEIASMLSERISHYIEQLYTGDYAEGQVKKMLAAIQNLLVSVRKYAKKRNGRLALMERVMDELGAPEEEKKTALYTSLMYDLGLTSIDETITKKGKLAAGDARLVQTHPQATVALLNGFETSEEVRGAIRHHHERFDGRGYPDGLKGETIPLVSRVLAVVDSYCAMIEDRPYRKAKSASKSLQEILRWSGSRYDPRVVKAFQDVLGRNGEI
jgi:HD-GYP domain-containing protein (c-di-GMP phosphodiesterase class II)/signal transduction histidine kinase